MGDIASDQSHTHVDRIVRVDHVSCARMYPSAVYACTWNKFQGHYLQLQ